MFKYLLALLCGTSISGSVYMAGWASPSPHQQHTNTSKNTSACEMEGGDCCDDALSPVAMPVSVTHGIDVGNTKCIVQIEDIGTSKLTVDYQGKMYHICCDGCQDEFNKDPAKFVKALEADPAKFGVAKK